MHRIILLFKKIQYKMTYMNGELTNWCRTVHFVRLDVSAITNKLWKVIFTYNILDILYFDNLCVFVVKTLVIYDNPYRFYNIKQNYWYTALNSWKIAKNQKWQTYLIPQTTIVYHTARLLCTDKHYYQWQLP